MKTNIMIALVLFSAVGHAMPATYKTAPDSSATFDAVGRPSLLKIHGEGATLAGEMKIAGNTATGKFELDLSRFDTGIETRTEHMKEKYLETQKYPKAFLTVEKVDLPAGFKPGQAAEANFTGLLKVKDVEKPVTGVVKIAAAGNMPSTADFAFKLSDYPVGVPKYLGITVADDVKVHVTIPGFTAQ
jgi:polyisoprenoid-binding protein YceI